MNIPHAELSTKALAAIVLEFVTRDGTDHSPVDERVASVLRQIKDGKLQIHFDPESETCHIAPV